MCHVIGLHVYINFIGCPIGGIRLRDGATSSEGRIEVCYDGLVWGTVCDNLWSDADAIVACRQLGFTASSNHAVNGFLR